MQGVSSLVVPMLFAVAINRQYPEREGAGLKVKKKKKWGGGGGGGLHYFNFKRSYESFDMIVTGCNF